MQTIQVGSVTNACPQNPAVRIVATARGTVLFEIGTRTLEPCGHGDGCAELLDTLTRTACDDPATINGMFAWLQQTITWLQSARVDDEALNCLRGARIDLAQNIRHIDTSPAAA